MSYTISLEGPACPTCGRQGDRPECPDPTYNLTEIFDLALWSGNIAEAERQKRIDWVLNLLPPIKGFYGKRAGFLSGGQQQMVSIGRTLLSQPRCLMMDEPSIGLAPKLFQDMLQPIRALQREANMAVILVEQNVRMSLEIADHAYVLDDGHVVYSGPARELAADEARVQSLAGASAEEWAPPA